MIYNSEFMILYLYKVQCDRFRKLTNRQSRHLGEIKLNTIENSYEDIKNVEMVPCRYLGPGGDEYTLINFGCKLSPGR